MRFGVFEDRGIVRSSKGCRAARIDGVGLRVSPCGIPASERWSFGRCEGLSPEVRKPVDVETVSVAWRSTPGAAAAYPNAAQTRSGSRVKAVFPSGSRLNTPHPPRSGGVS